MKKTTRLSDSPLTPGRGAVYTVQRDLDVLRYDNILQRVLEEDLCVEYTCAPPTQVIQKE